MVKTIKSSFPLSPIFRQSNCNLFGKLNNSDLILQCNGFIKYFTSSNSQNQTSVFFLKILVFFCFFDFFTVCTGKIGKMPKNDFNQQTVCEAPVDLSKYTTQGVWTLPHHFHLYLIYRGYLLRWNKKMFVETKSVKIFSGFAPAMHEWFLCSYCIKTVVLPHT